MAIAAAPLFTNSFETQAERFPSGSLPNSTSTEGCHNRGRDRQ